jgi:hypothetical protein
MLVLNLSNPDSPAVRSGVAFGANGISGISLMGENFAIIQDFNARLYVINIANPDFPFVVTSMDIPSGGRHVRTSGAIAFSSALLQHTRLLSKDSERRHPTMLKVFS